MLEQNQYNNNANNYSREFWLQKGEISNNATTNDSEQVIRKKGSFISQSLANNNNNNNNNQNCSNKRQILLNGWYEKLIKERENFQMKFVKQDEKNRKKSQKIEK